MKKVLSIAIFSTLLTSPLYADSHTGNNHKSSGWDGWRAGIHFGVSQGNNDSLYETSGDVILGSFDGYIASRQMLGGLHAGYDHYITSNWLVGLEGYVDLAAGDARIKQIDLLQDSDFRSFGVMKQFSTGINLKLGHAQENSQLYAGVGIVGTSWKVKGVSFVTTGNGLNIFTNSHNNFTTGLRLTIGASQKVNRTVLGLEANSTCYGKISKSRTFTDNLGGTNNVMALKTKPHDLDFRFKASYLFGMHSVKSENGMSTYDRWGGFKGGFQLGYADDSNLGMYKRNLRGGAVGRDYIIFNKNFAANGALAGVHGGYDLQLNNNWILGVDSFVDLSTISGKISSRNVEQGGTGETLKYSSCYGVGVGGRLGYALYDSVFYAGAGWVGSNWRVKSKSTDTNGTIQTFNSSKKKFASGLRLSLGMAQRMERSLVGIEGGYSFYQSIKSFASSPELFGTGGPGNSGKNYTIKVHPRVLDVKLKYSYMF